MARINKLTVLRLNADVAMCKNILEQDPQQQTDSGTCRNVVEVTVIDGFILGITRYYYGWRRVRPSEYHVITKKNLFNRERVLRFSNVT